MPRWQKVAAGPFWPCFAYPKLGYAGRTQVASKNGAMLRKASRPQFWLGICCYTALFLLATPVLPASPKSGQAKHGQNGPAATFCQQGICYPACKHHFTGWTHPDIFLRFRTGGWRVKKFSFSQICVAACDFFFLLNFDPIDLPNRYTPNFSGVPQKLTWCQQFGLRIFPKWGDAHICPQKNASFRCFFFTK